MSVTTIRALPCYADNTACWAAVALGVSIPISVAVDNVLLVLVLAGWLAGGRYLDKILIINNNPVSLAAIALFALLLVGTLYSEGYSGAAFQYLGKYSDLAFIPILLYLFRDEATRRRGLYAFAASLVLVVTLSYLIKLGLVPKNPYMTGDPTSPTVFKLRITHNILMAFAAYLFARLGQTATSWRSKIFWSSFALLAAVNVVSMVQGATGYFVLGGLILLLGYNRLGWRGVGAMAAVTALVTVALLQVPGPFKQRIDAILHETEAWKPDQPTSTSPGLRLEFYRNTLSVIRDHPFFGVGTGGLPKAYAAKVSGTGMVATANPHNEFLHITAQLGVIGLAALLWLFWRQWRMAGTLALRPERELARALVVTMVIGCMLNSLLLDHTEGLLYAWLTGLLYSGLESADSTRKPPA